MPKIKTSRGAAKRIKVTASGKFTYKRAGLRHLLVHKGRKRRRRLSTSDSVEKANLKAVRRLLPYGV